MNKRIAVLLTTFNRKEKTLACMENIHAQHLPAGMTLSVYLTDDASKDGTAQAVKEQWPQTNLYNGNGSYFWAGGMRNSWRNALKDDFDYYLLLNDDTLMLPDTLLKLLTPDTSKITLPAIIVGSTADAVTNEMSYGGKKVSSRLTFKNYPVFSETDYTECDLGNANIMLVSREVVQKIGILSDSFTHGIADYDYTLKAVRAGFKVYVAPGVLGFCTDDHGANWKSANVSLKDRIKYLKSPKGLAYKEYLGFIKDHFPLHYPSAFVKLWMKTLFPFVWDTLKK